MDGFQGAVLNIKLQYLKKWTENRNKIATAYSNRLKDVSNILNATLVVDYMRDIHKQTSLVELVKELQKKLLDSLSDDN